MRKLHTIRIVAVILLVAAFLSGCTGGTSDAQTDFENIMNSFKTANKAEIEKVYNLSEVLSFVDDAGNDAFADAIISTLSKMEYKVNSAQRVSSNAVKLNVTIRTVDYSKIVERFVDNVVKLTESRDYKVMISTIGEAQYQKLMKEQMIKAIEECGEATTTKAVEVVMTKSGDKWKIGGDSEEFLGALFVNLSAAVEALM